MGVERDQVHISDLWVLHVANHLPGDILVFKPGISKLNHLPGDISLEVSSQIQIDRTNHRKHDPPHNRSINTIIQKPFPHPAPIAKFLCHFIPLNELARVVHIISSRNGEMPRDNRDMKLKVPGSKFRKPRTSNLERSSV